jgi:hypothetical protein
MSCPYYHCDIRRLCMYVGFLGMGTFDDEAIGPNVINVLSIRSVLDLLPMRIDFMRIVLTVTFAKLVHHLLIEMIVYLVLWHCILE